MQDLEALEKGQALSQHVSCHVVGYGLYLILRNHHRLVSLPTTYTHDAACRVGTTSFVRSLSFSLSVVRGTTTHVIVQQ
jgi:hypothetical protein